MLSRQLAKIDGDVITLGQSLQSRREVDTEIVI